MRKRPGILCALESSQRVSIPAPAIHVHSVQFYETEAFLAEAMARFLGEGITRGEPVVVIATPEHRLALTEELRRRDVDVDGALARDQLRMLDADATLAQLMVGDMPD